MKIAILKDIMNHQHHIEGDSTFMSKKQVTFADIAEYTNFSKTTISRYFNHPDSLTLENQEKFLRP